MEKNERLLDLIALFLDAKNPLTFADLAEALPEDYACASRQAALRRFERDKADLADLGVELVYRAKDEDGAAGYALARDDYYLPQLALSPEELAVLFSAGAAAVASGAFPGRADLAHALRKIAFVSASEPDASAQRLFVEYEKSTEGLSEKLELLWKAMLAKKRVKLRYRGPGRGSAATEREVDPWGVCLRRGVWVLVGYCHLRRAKRTFLVERVEKLEANESRPRHADYETPKDFDVASVAREQIWEHPFHRAVDVELRLSPELAPMASRLFPNAELDNPKEGAPVKVRVRATYLDGLLRRVLALGAAAKVVAPKRAVARREQMLRAVEKAHTGRPS